MKKIKSLLLLLMVLFQIMTFIYVFINVVTAFYLIAFNILCFILLMVIVIMERVKEKREEDDDDYSNY